RCCQSNLSMSNWTWYNLFKCMNGENEMSAKRYTVHAPGKLFVAGEYAVTEPGHDSLVVAVDRYLSVDIQSNPYNRLDLPELKLTDIRWKLREGQVIFSQTDERLEFIKHVLETFFAYAGE